MPTFKATAITAAEFDLANQLQGFSTRPWTTATATAVAAATINDPE
jgi:hypothetical protein